MEKEIKFTKSESAHLLKKPLAIVLNGLEMTMQDADISEAELQINGVSFDFFIRAKKKPSENHEEIKPD